MKEKNLFMSWNNSKSSSQLSSDSRSASTRIFDGFYEPKNIALKQKFSRDVGIFTMGSCFARELESAFSADGFNILSMDNESLQDADFVDKSKGVPTSGFFHRYNIPAMLQEFQRSFGEINFIEESSLLVESQAEHFIDLNYSDNTSRLNLQGALQRREVGKRLVQRAAKADIIILTLGLTEAWLYKPDNLYANTVPADYLIKYRHDFEFVQVSYDENLAMLERLYSLLCKHHATGNFNLILTVSPVPLRHTFSQEDIVIANMYAKSTLRTVATEFLKGKDNVTYFPSYEIAMYSHRDLVWRPDRVHINKECVRFIIQVFRNNYIE